MQQGIALRPAMAINQQVLLEPTTQRENSLKKQRKDTQENSMRLARLLDCLDFTILIPYLMNIQNLLEQLSVSVMLVISLDGHTRAMLL